MMRDTPTIRSLTSAPAHQYLSFEPTSLDPQKHRRRDRARLIIQIAMPALLLGVWQAIAEFDAIDSRFFSSPTEVVVALVGLVSGGTLLLDVGATLQRLAVGMTTGGLLGVAVGIAMGENWLVKAAVRPLIAATYPIPKIALLPVLLLIFGGGNLSLYVLVGLAVFYLMVINTAAGIGSMPRIYRDVSTTYSTTGWQYIKTIAIPWAMPFIFAGVRLSTAVGLLALIAAEFTAADVGLGQLIYRSWQVFNLADMYAGIVVAGAIGWCAYFVLDLLERRLVRWQGDG